MNRAKPRFAALLLIFTSLWCLIAHADTAAVQTNVDQARHSTDDAGVPHLTISGVGKVDHPAWTALYALAYAGVEDYDPGLGLKADPQRFEASIAWLKANLAQNERGLWVWTYNFDSTYNDVSIKAPWSSAFAQATGIQALLAHWRKTQDPSSLELARKAAESLFVPLSEGGFLFSAGDDIWFEEIPSPVENPSHILNGHMRALLALNELKEATGEDLYQQWFGKGTDTLLRWLPLYDAGYWLRYDLNPRKDELLFRLANPYGFANPELAIDRIVLRDPESGEESVLDVGGANDAEGPLRIAGNDWGQIEEVGGRSVRRLRPTEGEREAPDSEGQMVAPYSYFYLKLPGKWRDNLRKERFELIVEYLDEKAGNIAVQLRSISPAPDTFKNLPGGDLLLSGAKKWRQWRVAIKQPNIGYWVGLTYAKKHSIYLNQLTLTRPELALWANKARGYLVSANPAESNYEDVSPPVVNLPQQTPMVLFSLDESSGLILQHAALPETELDAGFPALKNTSRGAELKTPVSAGIVNPQGVAEQLLRGKNYWPEDSSKFYNSNNYPYGYRFSTENITSKPAYKWLADKKNQLSRTWKGKHFISWPAQFDNAYNDIEMKSPWPSAFTQALIIKALAEKGAEFNALESEAMLSQALTAFEVPVTEGGLSYIEPGVGNFFEEVPAATHVLNAHILSINELAPLQSKLGSKTVENLIKLGLSSLTAHLDAFDTGYWLKYDQNPKKELLFQLDWIAGEVSPLIENISFESPQFGKRTRISVGSERAFEGPSRISGLEWSAAQRVDEKKVRSFTNGYLTHNAAVQGGTQQNAYVLMQLPESNFSDYFDVQPHRLVVRYKDVSAGQFAVKIQSINEGNVLDFTPLRNAVITTTGDQRWKEAVVEVRLQDMGWYKGSDYQVFEVGQLERIAKLTGDWLFEQYAERQRYFLEAKAKEKPVIFQPIFKPTMTPVELSATQSSPTYEGFGFENALDGDPNNDYVAGIENSTSGYVDLRLAKPIRSGVLSISWESMENYAGLVSVYKIHTDDEQALQLANIKINDGTQISIPLRADGKFQFIRVQFSNFSGQPRLLLRKLSLIGEISDTTVANDGSVFMLPSDDRNPLRGFGLPITHSIKSLSDTIVGDLKGHESILKLMQSFHNYNVGLPKDASPDGVVKERTAACGNFTVLLLALAASQGFEGRAINFYNHPKNMGHTVAEIYVDGAWRLYDPTFEGYYHYANDPKRRALSFLEILKGYESGKHIDYISENPRFGVEQFSGREIFTNAYPKGIIGKDYPMFFPLSLDAKKLPSISQENYGTEFQGANFLGLSYLNSNHIWKMTGLEIGKSYTFSIFPGEIRAPFRDKNKSFNVTAQIDTTEIQHTFTPNTLKTWHLKFIAKSDSQEITLRHHYTGVEQHYLLLKGFSLSENKG